MPPSTRWAERENLSDEEKEILASKAAKAATLFKSPQRVNAVCQVIVKHFYERIDPLGLKAQVVAWDRELCVLYHREISRLLVGTGDESTVVMTVADRATPTPTRRSAATVPRRPRSRAASKTLTTP
jgi:type I restriction enzyme R subunit